MKESDMVRLEAQDLAELGQLDPSPLGENEPNVDGTRHDDFFFSVSRASVLAPGLARAESKMRENSLDEEDVSDTRAVLVPAALSGFSKRLESRMDIDEAMSKIRRANRTIQGFINGGERQ